MKKAILLLMGVIMSSPCLASADDDYTNDGIVQQIMANEDLCVEKVEDGKIYLHHNRIYPTSHGIYLNLDDVNFILINNVSSDIRGCYLEARRILNNCPYCGKTYFVKCRNPDCPGKKK